MFDPMTVVLLLIGAFWLLALTVVLAACRMAAHSDAEEALRRSSQSPRRASTWGTVRKRILRSPHSDQFATYR